jgi:hypothetical protein
VRLDERALWLEFDRVANDFYLHERELFGKLGDVVEQRVDVHWQHDVDALAREVLGLRRVVEDVLGQNIEYSAMATPLHIAVFGEALRRLEERVLSHLSTLLLPTPASRRNVRLSVARLIATTREGGGEAAVSFGRRLEAFFVRVYGATEEEEGEEETEDVSSET